MGLFGRFLTIKFKHCHWQVRGKREAMGSLPFALTVLLVVLAVASACVLPSLSFALPFSLLSFSQVNFLPIPSPICPVRDMPNGTLYFFPEPNVPQPIALSLTSTSHSLIFSQRTTLSQCKEYESNTCCMEVLFFPRLKKTLLPFPFSPTRNKSHRMPTSSRVIFTVN